MAAHYVIIKNNQNEVIQSPLKAWIRQNLSQLPHGFDPDNQTTSQLRGRLVNIHWQIRNFNNEVFLIRPDEDNSIQFAEEIIADIQEEDTINNNEINESTELTFSLEKDLQAALRGNIETLDRVLLASRQIPNLKLIEYKFQFNFETKE